MIYHNFTPAILTLKTELMTLSQKVHTERWQGVTIQQKPEMAMREILNVFFKVMMGHESLELYRKDILPNIPWADNHFLERVCGYPINPGIEWANWPYGKSAAGFLDERGQFNHNYMERYWPKNTLMSEASKDAAEYQAISKENYDAEPNYGLRHKYGDLNDVVNLLAREPDTRQAYFPMWFPEDTGVVHKGRVPCTLGYQFLMRNDFLHICYYLRSCDFVRHFRDDVYLTVRLLLWVLDQLRERDERWNQVKPGYYSMHIMNLHCFENDYLQMKNEKQ